MATKKSAAKKAAKSREPKLVDHEVTQDDLDANPDLVEKGIKVGDIIQLLEETKGEYSLTVSMNDEVLAVKTDNIAESLLGLNPTIFKTKVVIVAEYEGRKAEFVLMIARAKRIFRNDLAALFFEKRVKMALNGQ